MMTIKDYILCYSPAYFIGVANGLLLAWALMPNREKRNHGNRSI